MSETPVAPKIDRLSNEIVSPLNSLSVPAQSTALSETSTDVWPRWNFQAMRNAIRGLMTYNTSVVVGERFVALVPHSMQRRTELLFDFPISGYIRSTGILLIRIPRTGSVSASFHIYGRVANIPHRPASFYLHADPTFFTAATKIAIVRNPWSRFVSAYKYLKSNGTDVSSPNPQTRRAMRNVRSMEHLIYDYLLPNVGSLHRLDPTLHHQHSYVCDENGARVIDHIFKLEKIEEFRTFMSSRGIHRTLDRLNASEFSPEATVRLPPAIVDAVATIYAKDIALFGYSYEHD